ncbi:hypothetical protein Tsubulata_023872 [Turnera subulata]|uniref:RING-type E3 ubiquitin transferase n=1 Tax=Turnera subulata TaxID=218843 RepID=A0A9Q0J395_9ROSI|nr:hypothetical protein Tsubulata_023872 [Turnera subulata]
MNSSQYFKTDQDWNCLHPATGQFYGHMGAEGWSVAPENGIFPPPMDNIHGLNHAFQHSMNPIFESAQTYPPIPGLSQGRFPQFPPCGGPYPVPEINASYTHSNHYNGGITNEVDGRLRDHTIGTRRGSIKRRRHSSSVSLEQGSKNSTYAAGSSSNTASDNINNSSGSSGLPSHMGTSLSFIGEDYSRNMRIRSRLDLEANSSRNYSSTHSSGPYYSTSYLPHHPVSLDAGAISHRQSHMSQSSANQNGLMNHETIRYNFGGNLPDNGRYLPESIFGRNHTAAAATHLHGFPAPDGRGRQKQQARKLVNGFYQILVSQRYPRPPSTRGWHGNHREGRPRIAIERFQLLSNARHPHDRLESEGDMVLERSYSYGSRDLFDQYRDIRLDVDSMSYEEVLALGDRIGNVNTGLSEDVIVTCLAVRPISSVNQEELSCVICLEEYNNMAEVGTMKKCGHSYHVDCIRKWLSWKNACPICKAPAADDK